MTDETLARLNLEIRSIEEVAEALHFLNGPTEAVQTLRNVTFNLREIRDEELAEAA